MNNSTTQVNQRLKTVKKDLSLLKKAFFSFINPQSRKTGFQNDEQVWETVKDNYEKIQEEMFREQYPSLYAKLKK